MVPPNQIALVKMVKNGTHKNAENQQPEKDKSPWKDEGWDEFFALPSDSEKELTLTPDLKRRQGSVEGKESQKRRTD